MAETAATHINNIEIEMDTDSRVINDINLDINSNNQTVNNGFIFCGTCKRRRDSELFTGRVEGKTYKTCSDCRLRVNNRRIPQAYQSRMNIRNDIRSIG